MKKTTDKNIYLVIDERIDRVVEQLEDKIDDLNKRVDNYEPKNIIKSLEVTAEIITEDKTRRLKVYFDDKIDDLEAKNYQIKKELDGIYKVLELTDEQIEGLIEYNNKKEGR